MAFKHLLSWKNVYEYVKNQEMTLTPPEPITGVQSEEQLVGIKKQTNKKTPEISCVEKLSIKSVSIAVYKYVCP